MAQPPRDRDGTRRTKRCSGYFASPDRCRLRVYHVKPIKISVQASGATLVVRPASKATAWVQLQARVKPGALRVHTLVSAGREPEPGVFLVRRCLRDPIAPAATAAANAAASCPAVAAGGNAAVNRLKSARPGWGGKVGGWRLGVEQQGMGRVVLRRVSGGGGVEGGGQTKAGGRC